jgi:F420-dependent oxidoreductase-like protein
MSKIRFGLCIPQGWQFDIPDVDSPNAQFKSIQENAGYAEEIGFDSIALFDHFHTIPFPIGYPVFECWTTLAALAATTRKIRLSQIVTCNSYREPSYLAKVTSIVDAISNGRVELGIGAGWYEHEYVGFGYDFPKASIRIGMLEEAVQIIKSMWTEQVTNFDGKYYKLKEAINFPKPVQKPHPPIMIGGGGEKLTLRVAAKHADIWNGGWEIDTYTHKLNVLREHCKAIGRDYKSIEKSYTADIFVAKTSEKAEKLVIDWKKRQSDLIGKRVEFDLEKYRKQHAVGSPEEVLERLTQAKKLGATYFIMYMPTAADRRLLELLYDEVVKLLKKA